MKNDMNLDAAHLHAPATLFVRMSRMAIVPALLVGAGVAIGFTLGDFVDFPQEGMWIGLILGMGVAPVVFLRLCKRRILGSTLVIAGVFIVGTATWIAHPPAIMVFIALPVGSVAGTCFAIGVLPRRRSLQQQRCPICAYDTEHSRSARCPECGSMPTDAAAPHRAEWQRLCVFLSGTIILGWVATCVMTSP